MTSNLALPPHLTQARIETNATKTARYAALTADFNPIHVDPDFAQRTPFGAPINHGTLGLSLLAQAIETTLGPVPHQVNVRFSRPAPVGVSLIAAGDLLETGDGYHVHVTTDDGVRVIEGTLHLLEPTKIEQKESSDDRN
ncbi:bifunctional enoyl-CoA hydratase/phosphate acetyltransferase (plasmid) [Antarctobacter heliothermus]|uniref:Bifunctional enoyl-CoA hydratase/phosphate acetyltransferase n=1 Tax=Antarctobacter heliothermus TaxID=74033 RepID=A0A222EBE9_9RHOB|nr:MaoC family dehydratase [Antarctobacter heliothermus]ASP23517.1 bifunctional enoyl-CoA hydratase/phosphate acetyltransferase [Antarctobacter heliothermus]